MALNMMELPMVSVLAISGALGSPCWSRLSLPRRLPQPAMTPRVPWPVASIKIRPSRRSSVSVVFWWQTTAAMRPLSMTTSSMLVFR